MIYVVSDIHGKYEIYHKNNHHAIDCGVVYGGRLAAYCLDTEKEFYIEKKKII